MLSTYILRRFSKYSVLDRFRVKLSLGLILSIWRPIQNKPKRLAVTIAEMPRILNVAEKNDAAKCLAEIMSNGHYNRTEGRSKFNKIYEYPYFFQNENCQMVMTSVSGHLLEIQFSGQYKNWMSCNPVALFDAPVLTMCPKDNEPIKKTLENEARKCSKLIIWTDGDREGENIGFEIIGVCLNVNPRLTVLRARFSEITRPGITRAIQNLEVPDKNTSDAVEVRKELDLRIGASFTRFQTLRLQKKFPLVLGENVISYGSCQFPTMGFVIERYKAAENFIPQNFWKIQVKHERNNLLSLFTWERGRLFDKQVVVAFAVPCWQNRNATVKNVTSKPKSKWRPLPLDTVELEKNGSRKLQMTAKETMKIAESLYTKGFISYPRTETNIFAKEIDLPGLVQLQTVDGNWGAFAQRVLEVGPNPRQGKKTDNAHPPIHPTKYANNLSGNDKKIYDFVVRHFLACLSQDAKGMETRIEIQIANEFFSASGLLVLERNYLDVYPYENWSDKEIPIYNIGEVFNPDSIEIEEGCTTAPALLTEADLITLMEKHGIGTDATHAEHIEKIKSRVYVGLNNENRFVPGELGIGLSDGYDAMGVRMSKPQYRAELEADLKRICEGQKNPDDVLREQIAQYKIIFITAAQEASKLDIELAKYFGQVVGQPNDEANQLGNEPVNQTVMKCPKCGQSNICLRPTKDGKRFFLGCMAYPLCDASIWFPDTVEQAKVSDIVCQECQNGPVRKIQFKHRMFNVVEDHTACFGGCDRRWFTELEIRPIQATGANNTNQNVVGSLRGLTLDTSAGQRALTTATRSTGQRTTNVSRSTRTRKTTNSNTTSHPDDGDWLSNGNNTDNIPVPNCQCGTPSTRLTTKKAGPNLGRRFFKCSEQMGKCNFFQWEDEANQPNNFNVSNVPNNYDGDASVKCSCDLPAKLLTVMKENQNKGRKFYICSKPKDNGSCGFFKWADETL